MNPELQRNLWLELTLHRMIAMPAVLLLAFFLVAIADQNGAALRLTFVSGISFVLLAMAWGTRNAAESISDEVRDRTWDTQRMSALSPWAMTWGKLAGSTSFTWYGGTLCLLVFAFSSAGNAEVPTVKSMLLMVAGGIALQASALASSLLAAQKGWAARGRLSSIIILILLLNLISAAARLSDPQHIFVWYGAPRAGLDFMLVSVFLFAAWGLLGAYRLMCQALMVRTTPWAWCGFNVFLVLYTAGFFEADRPFDLASLVSETGLVVCGTLFYLMLFLEGTGAMSVRRLLLLRERGEWRRLLQEIPCWPVSLALSPPCAAVLAATLPAATWSAAHDPANIPWYLPIALAMMFFRDAALYLFFAFGGKPRRAEATTLFYLLLLDLLLPMLATAAGAGWLAHLSLPLGWDRPWAAIAAMAVHTGVAVTLCVWRWRKNFAVR